MLLEIRSTVFRVSPIRFHQALNVVLGDENATNSIGKSTLLMLIDFAFGGSSLLDHNSDLVSELGHHDYFFTFQFGDELYNYRRGTAEPRVVYRCDVDFEPTGALGIEDYSAFLKHAYEIDLPDLSFRSLVGLYSRVWGKDNLSVDRPLHAHQAQRARDCVTNLLKTFGLYGAVRDLVQQLAIVEAEVKSLNDAMRRNVVPSISKREYDTNQQRINELHEELDDIKANLARYATNISALVNDEVLELKAEKDDLLNVRLDVAGRLQRTQQNLSENRHIKSKSFEDLRRFIPQINEEHLAHVEEFHNGVARILRAELKDAEKELLEQLAEVDVAIARIDEQMSESIKSVKEPTKLVDRVVALATSLHETSEKNEWFDRAVDLRQKAANLRNQLAEEKGKVLRVAENAINDGLRRIVTSVFGPDHKSPRLKLTDTNYAFEVFDDTGTGTAYASLVFLDLTVFLETQLPFVVHDTLLFKNIENDSVARLVKVYMQTTKQSFVALDEIDKYGAEAAALLYEQSVIQLDNSHLLFIKDWRR